MRTFKTEKGTELPLLNLRGKEYLQVAHRIIWFRERYPDGRIDTEAIEVKDTHSVFKATISVPNELGIYVKIADGWKREDKAHFQDHIEKASTGAIGRALALCGFGTQFAHELDEEERLADAPLPNPKKPRDPSFNTPPSQNTPSYNERRAQKMSEPMTEKQRSEMKRLGDEIGMSASERMDFLQDRGIDPHSITKQEASDCIAELMALAKPIKDSAKEFGAHVS